MSCLSQPGVWYNNFSVSDFFKIELSMNSQIYEMS